MVGLSRALFLIGRIDRHVSEILLNALSLSLMVTMSIGYPIHLSSLKWNFPFSCFSYSFSRSWNSLKFINALSLINHQFSDIFACNALWWNKGVREGTILKSEIGYRDIFSSVLHINDSSDLPDPVTGFSPGL